ncbi:disks large-associated protein 5 isoform X2 [Microplitis demolitor]|uniref:disks large-associated protein 5 isoform X2 n=1 Tax=Microplitis demolitor TaxID=69319 RepID=UPI0004CCDB0B|nr:disks large-associated protein 5 isoform X2 [Microplitis demolitor]
MDRINLFKQKKVPFQSQEARLGRALDVEQKRKHQRAQELNRVRAVDDGIQEDNLVASPPRQELKRRLELWRAEKMIKKKIEAAKKKPAFKVGIPHHKIYSPKSTDPPLPHQHGKKKLPKKESPVKRITRATAKRLEAKSNLSKVNPSSKSTNLAKKSPAQTKILANSFKSPSKLVTRTPVKINSKTPVKVTNKTPLKSLRPEVSKSFKSIAPDNYVFKPPAGIESLPILDQTGPTEKELSSRISELIATSFKSTNISHFGRAPANLKTDSIESKVETLGLHEMKKTPINKSIERTRAESPVPAAFSPFIITGRGKNARKEQRDRLLNNSFGGEIPTKETVQSMLNTSLEDKQKTAQYYKYLLGQETEKLEALCRIWEKIQSEETIEDGVFIINQAIGQSKLLIKKKFHRFSLLVADCESNNPETLVGSQDLQGFWEMMGPEIRNCHDRFAKLEKLKEKDWVEEEVEVVAPVVKKVKAVKKNKVMGSSKMKMFIEAARKKKLQEQDAGKQTPDGRILRSRMVKTPEVKLDSSISYINSDQTPGKSILKKKTDGQGLNKSVTKVNFTISDAHQLGTCNDVGVDNQITKKLEFIDHIVDPSEERVPSKAAQLLAQKLFGINRRKRNRNVVELIETGKPSAPDVKTLNPVKEGDLTSKSTVDKATPKQKRARSLTKNKENTTPSRRSSRKSIRLNVSDDCTACEKPR